jgi:outer membrane protein TolC
VSLGVKMSAFDGLEGLNRTAQAERDAAMAAEALGQQEKLLRISVRRAVEAVTKADAQVRAKQSAAAYAVERSRIARVSAESGLASRQDMRGAEVFAGTAALDLLLARYTLEEALADLARLSGERP